MLFFIILLFNANIFCMDSGLQNNLPVALNYIVPVNQDQQRDLEQFKIEIKALIAEELVQYRLENRSNQSNYFQRHIIMHLISLAFIGIGAAALLSSK